jgi:hypothetical protein
LYPLYISEFEFGATTFDRAACSIMTLDILGFIATLSIMTITISIDCCYAKSDIFIDIHSKMTLSNK